MVMATTNGAGDKRENVTTHLDKRHRRILADVQHRLQTSQDRRISASEILRLGLIELAKQQGVAI